MPYLILIFGVFCCATSVIFIKIGNTDPVVLSAYRLILGGLFLLPFLKPWQKHPPRASRRPLLRRAIAPSVLLAFHFITWITAARLTPSANASLIVNMVPVAMPFLLLIFLKERINRHEAVGTLASMAGVALLAFSDFSFSTEYALGDALCFVSMLFYATYLIYARKSRDLPSIYLYVIPVYLMSGLICLLIAMALELSSHSLVWIGTDLRTEIISILGLALVPTVLGHSIVNWAMRTIRGQAVAIINLSQFIFAGILGFLLLGEIPQTAFYIASLMIVTGAIVVVTRRNQV